MVTRPVTLKAMLRVCADLAAPGRRGRASACKRWARKLRRRGARSSAEFRTEGFYERFPAKGQVERVARVHRRIDQLLGITPIAAERAAAV